MHVLILPSWYPRYDGDAEGSFFRDQAQALADSGLTVGVVFADLRGPRRYFRWGRQSGISVRQDESINEVRSHGFNWFSRDAARYEKLWLRHAEKAFATYVDRFGMPDILHVHSMEPAGSFAVRIADRCGMPFVITEHSTFFLHSEPSATHRQKIGILAAQSSCNIAVSPMFSARLTNLTHCDWQYVPNIVSERFLSAPTVTHDKEPFRLVSVALLSKHKRMDVVIDAVAALRNRGRNVALTIIGDGSERARLERMVGDLVLTEVVEFAGRVALADMPKAMGTGDLLVSASDFETFGVTLIEGMALGMPVVATRSGGPDSIVTSDVGTLVPLGDPIALADAVAAIMDNIERYRPADIRTHCDARFSPRTVCRSLTTIYAEAIANARR
ncbi:glycosyltransferase [Sphingomonas hankookensis]|uniref:glycosyltransferase n=1 Tax=Sphingomonas hankookensis TaxID=563996 RepID=UPI00234FB5A9|nr:glycosyltransferase [Sphingomonas hankookensis]WCP73936.1 glycosyltransferase [Sphingomonas hankookensis]